MFDFNIVFESMGIQSTQFSSFYQYYQTKKQYEKVNELKSGLE